MLQTCYTHAETCSDRAQTVQPPGFQPDILTHFLELGKFQMFIKLALPDIQNILAAFAELGYDELGIQDFSESERRTIEKLEAIKQQMLKARERNQQRESDGKLTTAK